jgi:hypothetical protein
MAALRVLAQMVAHQAVEAIEAFPHIHAVEAEVDLGRGAQPSGEFGRAVELGTVSPASFAADCFRGEIVPDHPESVVATAWLYESGLVEGARIWEESVVMPYYDSVLSLLNIREPIEQPEPDSNAEAELDPAEFTLARKLWPVK